MPATIDRERLMTVLETAALLEVTPQHVRALVRRGRLAATHTLFGLGIRPDSVHTYAANRGPWPRYGVYGGKAAAHRMGINTTKETQHD